MKKLLLATLLCMLAIAPAFAQEDNPEAPFQVRIEGYIGDAPAGVKPSYSWTAAYKGKTYTIQVIKHESLSATVSTMDINESVLPYQPNFNLTGDDKALAAFTEAKAGQLMEIMADMRIGGDARELHLGTVKPLTPKK